MSYKTIVIRIFAKDLNHLKRLLPPKPHETLAQYFERAIEIYKSLSSMNKIMKLKRDSTPAERQGDSSNLKGEEQLT